MNLTVMNYLLQKKITLSAFQLRKLEMETYTAVISLFELKNFIINWIGWIRRHCCKNRLTPKENITGS